MHPMFVKLYLENDADDVLAEEDDRRRAAHRARQAVRARPPGSSLATGTAGPPGEVAIGAARRPRRTGAIQVAACRAASNGVRSKMNRL